MIDIQLQELSAGPVYLQIRTQLEGLIRGGRLGAGESLPTPAALARQLSVDAGEVQRAYFELEHYGLVTKTVGRDFLGKERVTYAVK
jgi:DNA-binding transcriptional regulator YhcF (GntR family)